MPKEKTLCNGGTVLVGHCRDCQDIKLRGRRIQPKFGMCSQCGGGFWEKENREEHVCWEWEDENEDLDIINDLIEERRRKNQSNNK